MVRIASFRCFCSRRMHSDSLSVFDSAYAPASNSASAYALGIMFLRITLQKYTIPYLLVNL